MADDLPDEAWEAILDKPATRGELLRVMELVQFNLLSQSMFGISHIDSDETTRRMLGENTLEHSLRLLDEMRSMIDRWKAEP